MPKRKFAAERFQLLNTFKGIYDTGTLGGAADSIDLKIEK